MKGLFQKLFAKKPIPLTGAPAVRRRTYSAQSGYAYQYHYEGHRGNAVETEYVFTVSGDRKLWLTTSVRLANEALRAWEKAHGRELSSTEQYAVAKMALFQAFDERTAPSDLKDDVCVTSAEVESIVETLGL